MLPFSSIRHSPQTLLKRPFKSGYLLFTKALPFFNLIGLLFGKDTQRIGFFGLDVPLAVR